MTENSTYSILYFIIPASLLLLSNLLSWVVNYKNINNLLSISTIIFVLFFSFFRENIPSDYITYKDIYINGFESKYTTYIEPFWVFLSNNIYLITNLDFKFFVFFIIVFSLIFKIKFYKKNGLEYSQFLYFYYIQFWLLLDLGALRRSLAMTLVFVILSLSRFSLISAAILVTAILLHSSAIVCIPLIAIYFYYNKIKNKLFILIYILLFSLIFCIPFLLNNLDYIFPGKVSALIGSGYGETVNILLPGFLMRVIICAVIFMRILNNKNVTVYEKCYILYVPFFLFGIVIEPLSYLAFYPRIFEPIIFNDIIKKGPTYLKIIVLIIMISMITIILNSVFMNEYLEELLN